MELYNNFFNFISKDNQVITLDDITLLEEFFSKKEFISIKAKLQELINDLIYSIGTNILKIKIHQPTSNGNYFSTASQIR